MQDNYSNENTQEETVLYNFNIDWPYERIAVRAKVISSQTRNIFKWAVIRILEDFSGNPPTLTEAADQLGIKDSVFLKEALEKLGNDGTIEKIDSEKDADFSNYRIVNYDSMQPQHCEPELHGFTVFFDAVTGMYCPDVTSQIIAKPRNPALAQSKLPQLRTEIGLEKARNFARMQKEAFLTAQSNIIDVKTNRNMSAIVWVPVKASIVCDNKGTIRCRLDSADQHQQQWLDKLDLDNKIFKQIFESGVDKRFYPPVNSALSFEKWKSNHDSLIAPDMLTEKAVELISASKVDILIDAYWVNFDPIQRALSEALDNNVAVTICARNCQYIDIPEYLAVSSEVVELKDYPCILLISDKSAAISIDQVEINTSRKMKRRVIVSSFLKRDHALELKHELVKQRPTVKTY